MIMTSDPATLWMVAGVYVLAGFIKGVIGIGLPTTALALLTFIVTPLQAIAINILPMLVVNLYQFLQADSYRQLVRDYWRFALFMMLFLGLASVFAAGLGNDIIRLLIAISIMIFTLNNLFGVHWRLNPHHDRNWQYAMGTISGILGGLTSLWGVPMTIYLVMKQLSPKQFVDATGFLILIGCFPLAAGYISTNILTSAALWPAGAGIGGAFIGFYFGALARKAVSPALFHKLVLVMFLVMGLKMSYDTLLAYNLL